MKKVFILLSIVLFSCDNSETVTISKNEYNQLKNISPPPLILEIPKIELPRIGVVDFNVVQIDECEYIGAWWAGDGTIFSHKGNCKFCIERQRKMIKEILIEILKQQYESRDSIF